MTSSHIAPIFEFLKPLPLTSSFPEPPPRQWKRWQTTVRMTPLRGKMDIHSLESIVALIIDEVRETVAGSKCQASGWAYVTLENKEIKFCNNRGKYRKIFKICREIKSRAWTECCEAGWPPCLVIRGRGIVPWHWSFTILLNKKIIKRFNSVIKLKLNARFMRRLGARRLISG